SGDLVCEGMMSFDWPNEFLKRSEYSTISTMLTCYHLKQSVALVIAMGGLYPCPEVIEAILNPEDGQTKHILDIGVDLTPPPVDTGVFPSNLQFEIDDINNGLSHFYDQYDLVHLRCVMGGIKNIDESIVELQKCLKPGGVLLIIEGDMSIFETREIPARLKKLPGDPDVSSVSEDGSWLRRMVLGENWVPIIYYCWDSDSLPQQRRARRNWWVIPPNWPLAEGTDQSKEKALGPISILLGSSTSRRGPPSSVTASETTTIISIPNAPAISWPREEARDELRRREGNIGELPEMVVQKTWRSIQDCENQGTSSQPTSDVVNQSNMTDSPAE
ncbi:13107_t:CDS:2, partial [Acaulospora colombiana]